jgi:hypothetical protein
LFVLGPVLGHDLSQLLRFADGRLGEHHVRRGGGAFDSGARVLERS